MQQLNKMSILETVAFVRDTRTRQYAMFALSKLAVFLSGTFVPLKINLPIYITYRLRSVFNCHCDKDFKT